MKDEADKTPADPQTEPTTGGMAPLSDTELNEVAGGFTSPFSTMALDKLKNGADNPGPK